MLHKRSTIMNWQVLEVKAILSGDSVMLENKYVQLKKCNQIRHITFNITSPGNKYFLEFKSSQ